MMTSTLLHLLKTVRNHFPDAEILTMNDQSNRPISEQFRIVAKQWVDADNAARLLEETKTAVLAQRMAREGDIPAAHAERNVKSSEEWHSFVSDMVNARTAANRLKVQLEFIRMQSHEQQSFEATKRAEMKL